MSEEKNAKLIEQNDEEDAGKNEKKYYSDEERKVGKLGDLAYNEKGDPTKSVLSIHSNNNKKSFAERWFSKINPDSLRGNIFNLSIICLGTGTLALPIKIRDMTILVGSIAVFGGGIGSFWTLNLLVIAGLKHNIYDYSQIVKHVYGKVISTILDITIALLITGQLMLYQVIGKKNN
jgi:hypothetical protein